MLYLVSYDLTGEPETEYEELFAHLQREGAVRILFSEWLLPSDDKALAIRDEILTKLKDKDYLWVVEVTTNSAWHRTRSGNAEAAKALFKYARD